MSALQSAFSGVYSLAEGGGRAAPHARAASNRALWRRRLVASLERAFTRESV